jgi:hypothetical protein
MLRPRISKETILSIYSMAVSGMSNGEISTVTGITKDYICKVITRRCQRKFFDKNIEITVPLLKRGHTQSYDIEKIMTLFTLRMAGYALKEIAFDCKVPYTTLTSILRGESSLSKLLAIKS